MSYSIYHDFPIREKIDKVYNAITDPQHLINWWPLKCSGQAIEGHTYQFYFSEEYDWEGKVIKSIAGKSFHVKMTKADEDWTPTSFGFDLKEIQTGQTTVQFWHINWPSCNEEFRQSSWCWAILLKGLKDYLEQGIIVPFEERE